MKVALENEIDPAVADILTNPNVVRKLGRSALDGFDRAGLLSAVFAALAAKKGKEGQAVLADVMVEELFAGKPGATNRTRILDTVCRLLNWHSDDVHAIPVEEMSEDELRSAIACSLPRLKLIKDEAFEPARGGATPDRGIQTMLVRAGKSCRRRRVRTGLTQEQFAEAAQVALPKIQQFELGRAWPSILEMGRMADALRVNLGRVEEGQFCGQGRWHPPPVVDPNEPCEPEN